MAWILKTGKRILGTFFTRHSYLRRQGWYFHLLNFTCLITETTGDVAKDEEINATRLTLYQLGTEFHNSNSTHISESWTSPPLFSNPHQKQ